MALLALTLAGVGVESCQSYLIRGNVVDIKGEAIPGVCVAVAGTDIQKTTNALGEFQLWCAPGALELTFMKTGFTPGKMAVASDCPRAKPLPPVTLWNLPPTSGVYLFEDFRYRKTTSIEARPFSTSDGDIVYGLAKLPDLDRASVSQPLIVMHGMPPYDLRLSALRQVDAAPIDRKEGKPEPIWVAGKVVLTELAPIDEPERELIEVKLLEPLETGVYAIHWGALEGHAPSEARAFLFAVGDPCAVQETPPEDEEQDASKSKQEVKPKPPEAPAEGADDGGW